MRILAAENGMQSGDVTLPRQRIEIMRKRHEIRLRRQLVGWVPPIAVGEDPQLPGFDECLQPRLIVGEIAGRGPWIAGNALRQRRRLGRIGFQCGDHVHPIERVQVIEVNDMIVHVLCRDHEIADELRVVRNVDFQRVLDRPHRGETVHERTHAADALGKGPGIARIASAQNDLNAANHGPGTRRPRDAAVGIGLGLNAQMAFDAGDGIDDHNAHAGTAAKLSATSSTRLPIVWSQ